MPSMTQPLRALPGAEVTIPHRIAPMLTAWLRLARWQSDAVSHSAPDAGEAQAALDALTGEIQQHCGVLWSGVLSEPLLAWREAAQHSPGTRPAECALCTDTESALSATTHEVAR